MNMTKCRLFCVACKNNGFGDREWVQFECYLMQIFSHFKMWSAICLWCSVCSSDAYDDHLNWIWKRQWMLRRWIKENKITTTTTPTFNFDENWKRGSWAPINYFWKTIRHFVSTREKRNTYINEVKLIESVATRKKLNSNWNEA